MNLRKLFRDLPFERKLLVITLAIGEAVSLVALLAFVVFQVWSFRTTYLRETATVAEILANNVTAALAFEDRAAANEILGSLKAKPTVVFACLVDTHGKVLAQFGVQDEHWPMSAFPLPRHFCVRGGHLLYTESVEQQRKRLGWFYLRCDYHKELLHWIRVDAVVLLVVLAGSGLLAFLLSRRLSRLVIVPVLDLAETAGQVGENNDYSVRSKVSERNDELGVLARAFDQMLSRIQNQEAALSLSQQKIESLVHSIDGIVWEWDLEKRRFNFVSQQSRRVLGYPAEQWLIQSQFWDAIIHPDDLPRVGQTRAEAQVKREPYHSEYRMIALDQRILWIRESGGVLLEKHSPVALRGILQDITEQKQAAEQLEKLHTQLVETSRQAGMAEVATSVLHNVGNILNSVNVSATLLSERIMKSKAAGVGRVSALLEDHAHDLGSFISQDPKGRQLPAYLKSLGEHLAREESSLLEEVASLRVNVEHIKQIVARQQDYARISGITEKAKIDELLDHALQLNAAGLTKRGVLVVRDYDSTLPEITVDKHKLLQILVNLVRNAQYACDTPGQEPKQLVLRASARNGSGIRIEVTDNGVGITSENLKRIFNHGFTTRKDGHGFGLHSGALSAREMGGSLCVHSDGPGRGATFTLELPVEPPVNASEVQGVHGCK